MSNQPLNSVEEDKQLVAAAQLDSSAFGPIYEKYVDKIYTYIFFRVNQHAETAEELTAEVFTRALQHLHKYTFQGYPYSSYLYQIARTICVDQYGKGHIVDIDEVIVVDGDSGTDSAELRAEIMLLWQYIEELPLETQELLQLRYIEDLPYEDIAIVTGKKAPAIRKTISRAIQTLKQYYEQ